MNMSAKEPPNERPPKDTRERSQVPMNQNMGLLVSEKDLTIKFLEFKNDIDRKFSDLRAEMEKRFNEIDRKFSDFKAEVEKRFYELERRIDVLQLKTTFILWALGGMFVAMVSGGGYIIKLLLDLHK